MVFGALVVLAVGFFLFNTLRNRASTPGVEPQITQQAAQTQTPQEGQVPQSLPGSYKVQKGDTLWLIAEKNYGSGYNWTDISEANKLTTPDVLVEGQELTLPQVEAKLSTAPTPQAVVTPAPSTEAPKAIGSDTYTVIRGDHLWGIAVRAYGDGYQWVRIWRANKAMIGNHPDLIYVGQTVTIPRDNTK